MSETRDEFDISAPQTLEELLLQIGPRVARLRDQNGWLQAELSRRTEIQPARISRIESGKVLPRLDELVRLGRALLASPDELVLGSAVTAETEEETLVRAIFSAASPEDRVAFRRLARIFLLGYRQGD